MQNEWQSLHTYIHTYIRWLRARLRRQKPSLRSVCSVLAQERQTSFARSQLTNYVGPETMHDFLSESEMSNDKMSKLKLYPRLENVESLLNPTWPNLLGYHLCNTCGEHTTPAGSNKSLRGAPDPYGWGAVRRGLMNLTIFSYFSTFCFSTFGLLRQIVAPLGPIQKTNEDVLLRNCMQLSNTHKFPIYKYERFFDNLYVHGHFIAKYSRN
jgi:hypothetical protein